MFRSLYRMGAFNGDPHPGNYLFHDDGTVTFLDFGLVKHFSAEEMSTFGSMVQAAAVDHDHDEFRRIVEDAGMLRRDAPVSTEAVGEYFSHFYDTVRSDAEMTWTRDYANSIVRHTFDRTSPISQYATVPRAFVFIQRINLGPVRAARRTGGGGQLPSDRLGTVAVRGRTRIHRTRSRRSRLAGCASSGLSASGATWARPGSQVACPKCAGPSPYC